MLPISSTNYHLKQYYTKRIFLFTYGVFIDDTCLYTGGEKAMKGIAATLNGAFLLGISHSLIVNEQYDKLK